MHQRGVLVPLLLDSGRSPPQGSRVPESNVYEYVYRFARARGPGSPQGRAWAALGSAYIRPWQLRTGTRHRARPDRPPPSRSEHRQVHLHHVEQEVGETQARRSEGLTGTGERGEEVNVCVSVARILLRLLILLRVVMLVRLLVLAGVVIFETCGHLHLRRIHRTGRAVRKGDETSATGSESVEGLRHGGPLLRRAGRALEAEHGFRGEFQVDGESVAVHGQTQSSDAMFVGPNRPQPFALDQGRNGTRGGGIAACDAQQKTWDRPPDEGRADLTPIECEVAHGDGTGGGGVRTVLIHT